jgi:ferredoxin
MQTVTADFDICQGFGNCAMNAPDLFDLDDNDVVVVLKSEIPDEERGYAETAVRSCPVSALKLEPK